MLHIEIPGRDSLELAHLVSDLNGTLALDGRLLAGVADRLARLGASLTTHIVTAGTHGGAERAQAELTAACVASGAPAPHWQRIATGEDKARYVAALAGAGVVTLGNGANDAAMFRAARVSIGVLGGEGACLPALLAADIVTTSRLDALDLLLYPDRLVATLRR